MQREYNAGAHTGRCERIPHAPAFTLRTHILSSLYCRQILCLLSATEAAAAAAAASPLHRCCMLHPVGAHTHKPTPANARPHNKLTGCVRMFAHHHIMHTVRVRLRVCLRVRGRRKGCRANDTSRLCVCVCTGTAHMPCEHRNRPSALLMCAHDVHKSVFAEPSSHSGLNCEETEGSVCGVFIAVSVRGAMHTLSSHHISIFIICFVYNQQNTIYSILFIQVLTNLISYSRRQNREYEL